MLKPIRVTPTEQSQEFAFKLTSELETILQFMLMGNPCELTPFEAFSMPISTYLQAYRKKSVLITVDIEGSETDKIYIFFEFTSAIVLGCYLRQQPELVIKAKVKSQEFPGIAQDAFGEIGNQFTGALDRSIRHLSNAELHLVMDFEKNIFPDEKIAEDFFIKRKEYIVWVSTLTLEPYSKEKLTMLIPQNVFEKIIGQRITLVGLIPQKVAFYSHDKEFAKYVKENVESRYCFVDIQDDLGDIVHCAKSSEYSIVVLDFPEVSLPVPHDIDMFIKRILKTNFQNSKKVWVSVQNATPSSVDALQFAGLRSASLADAKKDLIPWINNTVKAMVSDPSK